MQFARSANPEGIAHFTRGIEALRTLPPTDAPSRVELDLLLSLGPTLRQHTDGAHRRPNVPTVMRNGWRGHSGPIGNGSTRRGDCG